MQNFTKCLPNGQILLQKGDLSVWAAPSRGMTVERLVWHGLEWIDCNAERRESGATYAVPILYPTPNRVKNDRFQFDGRTVAARMHGVARGACFELDNAQDNEQECRISAHLDFIPGSALYEAFPYPSRLRVALTAADDSLRWDYEVENLGDGALPYSFALHPFFKKHGKTVYQVNALARMEATAEKLPTGRILDIEPGKWDVCTLRTVESAALDDVFCARVSPMAQFCYEEFGLGLMITASEEFGRCVVYTPEGKDWFCLEPQTSSTNCHNLYNEGFAEAANLQIVAPHSSQKGFVEFNMIDLSKEENS